jgi:uncharacterized membrane protein YoaK (UPF0700 family)
MTAAGINRLDHVLGLTVFTAGAVDIISFVKLGGIFASAMTGNIAFLALYAARGEWHSAIASLVALVGFTLGAAGAAWFVFGRPAHHALNILLLGETLLLAGFIGCFAWFGAPGAGMLSYASVVPLSGAMGVQIIVGRKLNLSGVPTVVFTSTLTNVVVALAESARAGRVVVSGDTKRQAMSLALYFLGAFTGAVAVLLGAAVKLPFVLIFIAALLHHRIMRAAA